MSDEEVHAHLCNRIWRPYPGQCCSMCLDGLHNPGVVFPSRAAYDEFVKEYQEKEEPPPSGPKRMEDSKTEHLVMVKLDLGLDEEATRQALFDFLQGGSLNVRLEEIPKYEGVRDGSMEVLSGDQCKPDQEDRVTRRRKALEQIVKETSAYDHYILEEDAPGSPEDHFIARLRGIAIEALK